MKIQILSDLHNEFLTDGLALSRGNFNNKLWEGSIPKTNTDLIILAGDVDLGCKGVEWAIEQSNIINVPFIYVSGNHEYYDREYYSTLKKMRATAFGTNVHFLENEEIQIEDVRILGCTLWTDYNVASHLGISQVMDECAYALNDHSVIRIGDDGYFTPEHARKIHSESVKWLRAKLNETTKARVTVVVTHHGPSALCQHKDYPITAISGAFHSNLNELVSKADCWVYGHTHSNLDARVGNCRLVSNQPGYPSEDVLDFNAIKVIEI
jgi:predicted phosphodiesterase